MNKKGFRLLLLFLFVLNIHKAKAQRLSVENKTAVNEESKTIDAWVAHVDQDMNFCIGTFSDFIRKNFDAKAVRLSKNVYCVEQKSFAELSPLRIDVRAIFNAETAGTAVSFTFSPGYDIHFSNSLYKEEFEKGQAFAKSYVRFHYKAFYESALKEMQSKIKSKQKSIATNETKIKKNLKNIKDNDDDIAVNAVGAEKLKEKNAKLERENSQMLAENEKLKLEIEKLESDEASANESLKKTQEFY
jgi:hypothetical protein